MKLNSQQVMQNLQLMFPTLDEQTIQKVLLRHNGLVQPTIDDLLKLTYQEMNNDSNIIYRKNPGKKSNFMNVHNEILFDDRGLNDYFTRQAQEYKDKNLALSLQEFYDNEDAKSYEEDDIEYEQEEEDDDNDDDVEEDTPKRWNNSSNKKIENPNYLKNGITQIKNRVFGVKSPNKENSTNHNLENNEQNQEIIEFSLPSDDDTDRFILHRIDELYNSYSSQNDSNVNKNFKKMKVNDQNITYAQSNKENIPKKTGFLTKLFLKGKTINSKS